MSRSICAVVFLLALFVPTVTMGAVRKVPEYYPLGIQAAIDASVDGDTISVWGEGAPPYIYEENVNLGSLSIVVVNRSFRPGETPGYAPSWDHVVIDGQQLGRTVRMAGPGGSSGPRAVVKGFTITGGNEDGFGGGVYCENMVAVLESNYIHHNYSASGGGGIAHVKTYSVQEYSETLYVRGCLVTDNTADGGVYVGDGGGLYVDAHTPGVTYVNLVGNSILRNSAGHRGGGMFINKAGTAQPPDPPEQLQIVMTDNVVDQNQAVGGVLLAGGGVYTHNYRSRLRRNAVTGNRPGGIQTNADDFACGPSDLGTAEDPGFNILTGNEDRDYWITGRFNQSPPPWTMGNYWGSLDSGIIWSHILNQYPGPLPVQLDPIAASGKWFSVNQNSLCGTGVLVTGDLHVEPGVTLTIDPGKEIAFASSPDFNYLPGGDPTLCDLRVSGTLNSWGEEGDSVWFHPMPVTLPESRWYGISVQPQGSLDLVKSIVEGAYCGVDALGGSSLAVRKSRVSNNMLDGIRITGASGQVDQCAITDNGAIGVDVVLEGAPAQVSVAKSQFYRNAYAGIKVKNSSGADNCRIDTNIVSCSRLPSPAAPYGIMAVQCDDALTIGWNTVMGASQAGVCEEGSSAPSSYDHIIGNAAAGLSCALSSTPQVRWAVVAGNGAGVLVDGTSLPDLGTSTSDGNNSILTDNSWYVFNQNTATVPAVRNWWGISPPILTKFIGSVSYTPWRTEPPEGDGGQSAGTTAANAPDVEFRAQGVATSAVRLSWQLSEAAKSRVAVYDGAGRMVRTLADGMQTRGRHAAQWDCLDSHGRAVASGVYFCVLETPGRRLGRRVVLAGR